LKIIIGIPAFNEEKNIASIITKLTNITDTVIVCNDGSSDLTSKIAEKMGAIVINHKKNLGYGGAIRSIFFKAKEMNGDVLVTFDADGQHRVEDIQNVIEPIINQEADLVIGSRFLDESEKEVPQYRKVGIKVITKITNASIKKQLTDSQSGFRAYSKQVINELNPSELGMGISTEILIKASGKDFKISEVPIKIIYSGDTSTHNPITHGSSVIISTIKYTSLQRPLTFYGIPSMIFLIIGSVFSYLAIQYYVEVGRLNTNLTTIGASTVVIGVVLLITAILLFSLVSVVRENSNK
jgi:glycosyltransferase involved in cell wall biosynthesis